MNSNHLLSSQRLRKDERELDVDEENWFNDDIDENRVSSLNHGTLFNDGSDDDDSQPEMTSAISTSEPPRSRHSSSSDEDDVTPTTARSRYNNKSSININIGRSPVPSSSTTAGPVERSSPTSSQNIEPQSPYAMVRNRKEMKSMIDVWLLFF